MRLFVPNLCWYIRFLFDVLGLRTVRSEWGLHVILPLIDVFLVRGRRINTKPNKRHGFLQHTWECMRAMSPGLCNMLGTSLRPMRDMPYRSTCENCLREVFADLRQVGILG